VYAPPFDGSVSVSVTCCSVEQYVAVFCSALRECVYSSLFDGSVSVSVTCCSVLQCVERVCVFVSFRWASLCFYHSLQFCAVFCSVLSECVCIRLLSMGQSLFLFLVAVLCSVLQCVALLQRARVCVCDRAAAVAKCQCVAVCCTARISIQCPSFDGRFSHPILGRTKVCACNTLQHTRLLSRSLAVSVLQCVATCCSML